MLSSDLTFDLSGDTIATSYYYYVQRSAQLPALAFVPAAILLTTVPMLASFVSEPGKWQHWASGALSSVNLAALILVLLPREDYLASLVKGHKVADHMDEAAKAQEEIKAAHALVFFVNLAVLLLQISAARAPSAAGAKKAK